MDKHPLVIDYVSDVCRQVKAKELRKDIREELISHLEELMQFKRDQGLSDDEAAQWAIEQMGDTYSVAKGLNQVHKPRIPWTILGSLALLFMITLVSMYAVDLGYRANLGFEFNYFFKRQTFYIAIGLIALFGLSRIHYKRLLHYSWWLYGGTVVLMWAAFVWGPRVNGSVYLAIGSFALNIMGIGTYCLIVSAAGILYQGRGM
ncbi:permease prefix domain 1-containing protein [Paenibacillus sp. P25]|nr:permease prefix domain 1-containing protein [Paenibacillus sp. P25]